MKNHTQIPAINALIDMNISHTNTVMSQTPTQMNLKHTQTILPHFSHTSPYLSNFNSGHYFHFPTNDTNMTLTQPPTSIFNMKKSQGFRTDNVDRGNQKIDKPSGYISMDDINAMVEDKLTALTNIIRDSIKRDYDNEIKGLKKRIDELELSNARYKFYWETSIGTEGCDVVTKPDPINNHDHKKDNPDIWASSVLMKLNHSDDSECSSSGESPGSDSLGYDYDLNDNIAYNRPKKPKLSKYSKPPRRGHLPEESTNILKKWLYDHQQYAYPNEEEKQILKDQTNLTMTQINNWFTNARRRILKSNGKDTR